MTLSEDIEPESHLIPRMIITQALEINGYEVIPNYAMHIKWKCGNPALRAVDVQQVKEEYYHEFDLRAKKEFEFGLTEEIYIEIGNEDDWDTRHSPANSSKYVYRKQMGNDTRAEELLHMIAPDAILIRPSKGEIIALGDNLVLVWNHIKHLCRKYVNDFLQEKSTTKF